MPSGKPVLLSHIAPRMGSVLSAEGFRARFSPSDYESIVDFAFRLAKSCPESISKHEGKISDRLDKLREILFRPDESKYHAASKDTFIVFFKDIQGEDRRRILHHELVHFIQQEGSIFEGFPPVLPEDEMSRKGLEPLLFEEAFAQYMASAINGFPDEKKYVGPDGKVHVYWLNECYRRIVGRMADVHRILGLDRMLDMFLDDDAYLETIADYDAVCGAGSFGELFSDICTTGYPPS